MINFSSLIFPVSEAVLTTKPLPLTSFDSEEAVPLTSSDTEEAVLLTSPDTEEAVPLTSSDIEEVAPLISSDTEKTVPSKFIGMDRSPGVRAFMMGQGGGAASEFALQGVPTSPAYDLPTQIVAKRRLEPPGFFTGEILFLKSSILSEGALVPRRVSLERDCVLESLSTAQGAPVPQTNARKSHYTETVFSAGSLIGERDPAL